MSAIRIARMLHETLTEVEEQSDNIEVGRMSAPCRDGYSFLVKDERGKTFMVDVTPVSRERLERLKEIDRAYEASKR